MHDLATENAVEFKEIILIGLPGYEKKEYLAENGFLEELNKKYFGD